MSNPTRPTHHVAIFALKIAVLLATSPYVFAALPGTGQGTCYDAAGPVACESPEFPGQDAALGGGAIGYDKLDAAGNTVDPAATQWSCVRDPATELVWEVKMADAGLRSWQHRYAWSNANFASNGGDAGGTTETEFCNDSLGGQGCTTERYAAAVNAAQLCGFADWRLPTQRELLGLLDAGAQNPAIATAFFPNTVSNVYWSADSYGPTPAMGWGVHFGYGAASADYKSRPYPVRLVRGTPF